VSEKMMSKLPEIFSIGLSIFALGLILNYLPTQATGVALQKNDTRASELFVSIIPVLKHPR